jgi:PAS domain S-box-containing protein
MTIKELRKSQEELEASRNKLALLYDFAPVGYFTLDRDGVIQTVNLTGMRMLGREQAELGNRYFEQFVADEERFVFRKYLWTVFAGHGKETCRVRLLRSDHQPLYVRIEAMATESGDECLAVLVDITERRRSEQALAESEYNLAKAQSMTHVGSWSSDMATGEIKASDELLRIMRLSPEETTQEAFASVVHPDDMDIVMKYLRLGAEHGRSYELEHRLQFGDGSSKWVYTTVEPSVNSAGKVLKLYGTTQDISERRQAEEALRESEAKYRQLHESMRDAFVKVDMGGNIVEYNRATQEMLGYTPGELPHLTYFDITPAKWHAMEARLIEEQVLRRGYSDVYEKEYVRKNGTIFPVELRTFLIRDNDGHPVAMWAIIRDITERKQAEVELSNKTNELQAIFDSISDGIVVYDHDGLVQHHNLISPQLYPREILPGISCQELFHPDTPSLPRECPVERAIRGERVETSLVSDRNGHKTQYVDVTVTPIRDALEEKNRALVFFRDISEKRLQEMHLIQTEKMSSIGVLATGIAHEINNPLTSVAGYAEALQRRFRDQPELKEDSRLDVFPHYLEVIIRESYRCKGIIDHLLNFGRRSEGVMVKVALNEVLQEILELIRNQPSYRQIEVVTNLHTNLPPVLGDPSGLRQVCMNLLINAHQAITGVGMVELTTGRTKGEMVFISIRDTGSGIEQGIIDRIWDPFFTTKEVGKGVGLGLALTYTIIKRHGGEIRVESRVGEGTQFTVMLPVCRE